MKSKRTAKVVVSIIGVVFLMVFISVPGYAQMPKKINYQGYLTEAGGSPITGSVQMGFAIYDVASGGSTLWSEVQSVPVSDGRYSVSLGALTPISLTEAKPYWLGVSIAPSQS